MKKSRKGIPIKKLPIISTDAFLLSEWNFKKNKEQGLDPFKITLGSGREAHWICSKCGHEWTMKIAARNSNTRQGCNSRNCITEKRKSSLMDRYGVDKISSIPCSAEKRKKTNLEKYGVENPFASKEIQKKIKTTFKKKYGFENPQQSPEIKEKIKKTNIEKYGVPVALQNKKVKQKQIETFLRKYGVENPSQIKEFQDKKKETSLLKFGKEHHWIKDKKEKGDRSEYHKKYKGEFTKKLKSEIKERDNYTCMNPLCEKKDLPLLVHHIDNKKHNNNPENLITLCFSCHSKVTMAQKDMPEFYEFLFREILDLLLKKSA